LTLPLVAAPIVLTTLVFIAACIAVDLRTLRIPNVLTGPAILIGLALNAALFGWSGLGASAAGFLLAVALLLGPFALGGIGAGDVKMMAAVGALLGPRLVLWSLALGMTLGGLVAVIQLARRSRLREKVGATGRMILNAALTRSIDPLRVSMSDTGAVVLPYSLPLGAGTAGVIAITSMVTR
jgi:prepilin peptidase CpaA